MYEIFMVVYLVVALALIGFILIQQGKGAGMGASFGSGASGTVFGASGSGNFLTKTTTILAVVFFGVALGLGNLTSDRSVTPEEDSLFSGEAAEQVPASEIPEGATGDLPVSDLPAGDLPESDLPEDTTADLPVDDLPVETNDTIAAEDPEAEPKQDDGK